MRQWALLIGLNHYQHFQPLSFAQQDAQSLQEFLIQQAGFAPEHCLLLTDSSPQLWGRSTLPTYDNLLTWIDLLATQCLKPDDSLWLFFSGYGVCQQGVDYLVPQDGNPAAIAETCLSLVSLLNKLERPLATGTSLVLMDISRIQSATTEVIGMQTAQYTYQAGLATLLSCQPGQYSREISSLGHGLFTAALLEGLRYEQGATLATLVRFLGDRLPELSQYYYQPSQTPFPICPSKRLHKPLISIVASSLETTNGHHESPNGQSTPTFISVNANEVEPCLTAPPAIAIETAHKNGRSHSPDGFLNEPLNETRNETRNETQAAIAGTEQLPAPQATIQTSKQFLNDSPNGTHPTTVGTELPQAHQPVAAPTSVTTNPHSTPPIAFNPPNNAMTHSTTGNSMTSNSQPQTAPPSSVAQDNGSADLVEEVRWRPIWLWGVLGVGFFGLSACVLWRNWELLGTPTQAAQAPTLSTVSVPAPEPSAVPTQESANQPAPGQNPLSSAQNSTSTLITTNPAGINRDGAIASTPEQALDFAPTSAPQQGSEPTPGAAILRSAQTMVLSDQATPYRDAIAEAKKIPAQDPAHGEAQKAIATWSQTIFKIGNHRANQNQWDIAIMAMDLVPPDDAELQRNAQAAIAQWCPAIKNQPVTNFESRRAKEICSNQPL